MKFFALAAALALAAASALVLDAQAVETEPGAVRTAERALAESAPRARLAGLRDAIDAHEATLGEARAALRAVADSRKATAAELATRDGAAFATLSALYRIERAPRLALSLHPRGPVAAARASSVLSDAASALAARAGETRAALGRYAELQSRGATTTDKLRRALTALQAVRVALALHERRDRVSQNLSAPEREAALAVESLAGEAGALGALLDAARPAHAAPPDAPFAPPVQGRAHREGGGASVALSAPAYSVVRAPATVSLRFAGRAGGDGLTAVLEPQPGVLFVLRGLGTIDRGVGDTLLAGEPFAALGGPPRAADEFLIDASAARGTIPDETLYIDVVRGGEPDDPAAWFALTAERTGG